MHNGGSRRVSPGGLADRRGRGRLAPPVWVWAVLVLAGAAIVILRAADPLRSHAKANIGTLIAAFAALVSLVVWFSLLSGYPRRARLVLLIGTLAGCGVLAALFRVDEVSGELVPRLALRFSPKPDELLEQPKPGALVGDKRPAVDLVTTTERDFPQFLGPDRSASIDRPRLARDWADAPPRLIWRQKIGAGWSGFAVVGRYAVTMEQRGPREMVTCYDVRTGQLQWFHAIPARYESVLAGVGPRATPTIDEGMVYTLGATGRLFCLDGATGERVWQKDLRKEYGVAEADEEAEVPYGRANSPLVVGNLVIVPAGGTERAGWVSLVAYDKKTGELAWEGGKRQISYSSPALATLAGVEQVLIVNQDYVSGHDVQTGKVLWEHVWPGKSYADANVSQAVPVPPDRVFLSKGYGHGAALVQLVARAGGTFEARQRWHSPRVMRTKFTNVALRRGYVYGLSDGILECIDLETGRRMWKSGRYGHGQILRAGGLLLVLAESGELVLVEATPQRANRVLGRFQALDGKTWNTIALSGPYLLVRNARQAACYRLAVQKP